MSDIDNLSADEQQAFDSILAQISGDEVAEEQPIKEEVANEPIAEEAPMTQAQEPSTEPQPADVSKELFERLIANQEALARQNQLLQEKVMQPKEEDVSEEQKEIQKLKQTIGMDKLEQENAMLKQQLEQIMQFKQQQEAQQQEMMKQAQHQKAVDAELNRFRAERQGADEKAIAEFILKQPEELRASLDTPSGWRMVDDILRSQAQPTQKPDNIVASKSTQPTPPDMKNMSGAEQDMARTENILRQLGM